MIFDRLSPTGPTRCVYDVYASAPPAEMAAVLQQQALDFVRARIDDTI
jgi:hypothetical protein